MRDLLHVELVPADLRSHLDHVLSVHKTDRVVQLETLTDNRGRREQGLTESPISVGREPCQSIYRWVVRDTRHLEACRWVVLAVSRRIRNVVNAVETVAKVVHQLRANRMGVAEGKTAVMQRTIAGVVITSISRSPKWRGLKAMILNQSKTLEKLDFRRDILIDSRIRLVHTVCARRVHSVVVALRAWDVRRRVETRVVQGNAIQVLFRNDVGLSWDSETRRRIKPETVSHRGSIHSACGSRIKDFTLVDRPAQRIHTRFRAEQIAEITCSLSHAGDSLEDSLRGVNARALIVTKKEHLLLNDRPAKRTAKLILLVRRLLVTRRLEVSPGVQCLVAQELPGAPVKLVGPRLRRGVDYGSAAAAEFGRVVRCLDLEFSDCIDAADYRHIPVVVGVVIDSVQNEVILITASSIDRETSPSIPVGRRLCAVNRSLCYFGDSCSEGSQVRIASSI